MNKLKLLLIFVFLIFSQFVFSQFYETGQDPASVKYNYINTEHFKIIYPIELENKAQEIANKVEFIYPIVSKSLDHYPSKIPILIHNSTVQSNGFVVWAPKRIELYLSSILDDYNEDYLNYLLVHEFRHVVQTDKINKGFSKVLSYFFGQGATGAILGLYAPLWFLEGDAVVSETAFFNMGRGRHSAFLMPLYAQTNNPKIYSYEKATLGSYKNYTANDYQLGYKLVNYGINKYGYNIWSNTLKDISKNPLGITSFNRSLKKNTGLTKKQFYKSCLNEFKNESNLNDTILEKYDTINKISKTYTNYRYSQFCSDSLIITEKTSLNDISKLVVIDKNKNEKTILTLGYYDNLSLSCSKNKIAWNEIIPHFRWENKQYSVIKTYNFSDNKIKTISNKTRYFYPSISNDAKKIVAIENTIKDENFLVILDANNGDVLEKVKIINDLSPQYPNWSKNDSSIILVLNTNKGKAIYKYNIYSSLWNIVLDPIYHHIGKPIEEGDFIYFTCGDGKIQNVYALKQRDYRLYKITSVKYGADFFDISEDGKKLIFSNYTANGYNISSVDLDTNNFEAINKEDFYNIKIAGIYKEDTLNFSTIKDSVYNSKKYRKALNQINIHTWAPLYVDESMQMIYPGITLFNQNILGTTVGSVGYSYMNKKNTFFTNLTYKGFFPVFSVDYQLSENIGKPSLNNILNFTTYAPINLTHNKYTRYLIPTVKLSYKTWANNSYLNSLKSLHLRLRYYSLLKRAKRDLYSKYGHLIDIEYKTPIGDNDIYSSVFALKGKLYLPGFLNNNSFYLTLGYQSQNTLKNTFSYIVDYSNSFNPNRYKEIITGNLNYALPLAYPDFNIGSLLYIKRISGELFYDYVIPENNFNKLNYAYGLKLISDLHLLNIIIPFKIGAKVSLTRDNSVFYELLFNFDIYGL